MGSALEGNSPVREEDAEPSQYQQQSGKAHHNAHDTGLEWTSFRDAHCLAPHNGRRQQVRLMREAKSLRRSFGAQCHALKTGHQPKGFGVLGQTNQPV